MIPEELAALVLQAALGSPSAGLVSWDERARDYVWLGRVQGLSSLITESSVLALIEDLASDPDDSSLLQPSPAFLADGREHHQSR